MPIISETEWRLTEHTGCTKLLGYRGAGSTRPGRTRRRKTACCRGLALVLAACKITGAISCKTTACCRRRRRQGQMTVGMQRADVLANIARIVLAHIHRIAKLAHIHHSSPQPSFAEDLHHLFLPD